ncbi:ATP-binding protein [Altericista sp. CCNU0014]|uniref:ATP-binding protein n=1 Tax=Altericista sp. CCNU0014 TaxID=3082949 RepID=UPI00384E4A67
MTTQLSNTLAHIRVPCEFEHLKPALLNLAEGVARDGVTLTEDAFTTAGVAVSPFFVVVAAEFRALLQAETTEDGVAASSLTFDPESIAAFLKKLRAQVAKHPTLKAQLTKALSISPQRPGAASVYERLIQQLCGLMGQPQPTAEQLPSAVACRPLVDAALHQQVQQEQLINQVTRQIRQSLELPVILQTAVHKIRECLSVDRLLIYQFDAPKSNASKRSATSLKARSGKIAYESCASAAISPLGKANLQHQWAATAELYQAYGKGERTATTMVARATDLLDGPVALLYQDHAVRAQFVAPLLVQDRLWGLLIAHNCGQVHTWTPREIEFLDQMTDHLAIAIHQAELYQQLQGQKQTLEEQVAQRTQELSAALAETQVANRVKGEFLATMSHELRTPLTCVIGMSATLIRWSLGPLNDKQRSYLQTIHDSGEHLLELINDILDFSQAESGKAVLNLSEFSLTGLAQQSVQMLREAAEKSDIQLRLNLKIVPQRDRFVADARRVKQILFNLMSNAIKFTPAEGEVTLRVWVEPNAAIFQIEDSGIGISSAQQSLLFQKFQQLDTSYRRSYDGAGLGLALAKQLVDMHRGWIEVSSVEGQGSTFTVEIPNQKLLHQNEDLVRSRYANELNARVILIEDNEDSATLICEMLTAAGYHVVWIVEDSTALQQIKFLQPAAAIISVDRPQGNGLKLIQQFRQLSADRAMRIIALAPKPALNDPLPYLSAGADTFLTKPLNPEHLVHKMDMLLANETELSEVSSN